MHRGLAREARHFAGAAVADVGDAAGAGGPVVAAGAAGGGDFGASCFTAP
jgi:hypothetical protein